LNIENLGQSKSNQEIILIANIVRDYIIVIQEVVAGYGGAQAVARLADELNRVKMELRVILLAAVLTKQNVTLIFGKPVKLVWLEIDNNLYISI
jgi:hypothetical protein